MIKVICFVLIFLDQIDIGVSNEWVVFSNCSSHEIGQEGINLKPYKP
jgi:hypothetical protein